MNQCLPQPMPPERSLALQPTANEPAANGARSDLPARVLVIDDNTTILESVRKTLCGDAQRQHAPEFTLLEAAMFGADAGTSGATPRFHVDMVTNGRAGTALARQARLAGLPYAVAFVDMRMPGGWDGLETIEQLWRCDATIQVVICTAYSDHAWSDIVARLGWCDRLLVLRKPFEAIEVLQLACALSQKWQLQRSQQARLADLESKVEERVAELRRANRNLRMLSQCNEAVMRARSEPELLQAVCTHIVRVGGYRLAWVGYACHDEAKSVEPAAHAGSDEDYVHSLQLTWGDDERRRGVSGSVMRAGQPVVVRRISTDPLFAAWREDALARGFASCIALPVKVLDEVLGTLSIYSEEVDAFDAEEVRLLMELADGLGYGVGSQRETQQRKRFELQLQRQASFDALTGLANRFTLEARVEQSLADVRRNGGKAAMLFIDLDRLKLVNDTLGHAMGDRVLIEVARRLTSAVRESDTVARLGGDEFVVFMKGLGTPADVATVVTKIIELMGEPAHVDQHEIRPLASIGISIYPDDAADVHALMKNADTAMYSAKALGGNTFRFFAPAMNARAATRYALEADLRRALERDELCLHFQPQVSLVNGLVTGAEALLRWRHPNKGMVSPAEFIPLAEETGLIHPLGDWVMANVCLQLRTWLDAGIRVPPIAVNLSPRQFQQDHLVPMIEQALKANRIEPTLLEVEITESAVMHDVEAAIATLLRIKALGLCVALDDFGTGYSSLSHLKRLPIDRLKIDRSFVRDITTDPDDAIICNAVIGLAHNLQLTVIAEGVENEAQLGYLRRLRCNAMQGYLFSPPLPAGDFAQLLIDGRKLAL